MKKIIVYDFDKTLTYKDTLLDFFKFASKKDMLYTCKLSIYFISMIFTKINLIDNNTLKNIGIKLFLSKLSPTELKNKFLNYYKYIKFNKLYNNLTYTENIDYYIISASFEEYLKPIFPKNITVIGSQIDYIDNYAKALKFNCYKENKIGALKKKNIKLIDILYTDSYSDYALAEISKKIIILRGDNEIVCNNLNDFKGYFRK